MTPSTDHDNEGTTMTSIGVCNHDPSITCAVCSVNPPGVITSGVSTIPDVVWEPAIRPLLQDGPVVPWWKGTTIPESAQAQNVRLRARIRELDLELSLIRVELTELRHHMHEAGRNAERAREILDTPHSP